jgi:hypothetical protein
MELAQLKEGLYPGGHRDTPMTRPAGTDSSQPRAIVSGPCGSLFNGFLPGPKLATGFVA